MCEFMPQPTWLDAHSAMFIEVLPMCVHSCHSLHGLILFNMFWLPSTIVQYMHLKIISRLTFIGKLMVL